MTDFYDWVGSPEIREFLRREYPLSVHEKLELVCGAQRPLEDKYAALSDLLEEAERIEDRDAVEGELRALRWAFGELRRLRPGQIYICEFVYTEQDVGNLRPHGMDGIVFQTCGEVLDHLEQVKKERAPLPDWTCFSVEKWAPGSGGMEKLLGLDFYLTGGRFRPTMLRPLGEPWDTRPELNRTCLINWRMAHLEIPLPFQTGDLVRLEPPVLKRPVYAVLDIENPPVLNRYNQILSYHYLQYGDLDSGIVGYVTLDMYSEWRLIDWMHPAAPSELPPSQKILGEISGAVRRAVRDKGEEEGRGVLSSITRAVSGCRKLPSTLAELRERSEWRRTWLA